MPHVIRQSQLRSAGGARRFEAGKYGADVSFLLVDLEAGQGPEPHSHPYGEVFVILSGQVEFSVDGNIIEAGSRDIVVAEAETVHSFVNTGAGRLEMVNIHASGQMITRWFEMP
jgi:mannose-6-phosphate isomerase-like protein (cupin superfamily)